MKIVIEGVPPWDGEYEFVAVEELTNREAHRIKEVSGIRAGELREALVAGDTAAWVGLSVVTLARAGKQIDPDDLWDASINAIDLAVGDDADPPTQPESSSGSTGNTVSSGDDFEAAGV